MMNKYSLLFLLPEVNFVPIKALSQIFEGQYPYITPKTFNNKVR